jgi:uncharacterized protein YndB with AHSA1/START domain
MTLPVVFRGVVALALLQLVTATSPLHAQASTPAANGVTDATANGFTIQHALRINATPTRVFEALSMQVGRWWNPAHTYSGSSDNLWIDARAGGCFCESLPNGGIVEHQRIVNMAPPSMLRLSGGLGPLQAAGVAAHLTWQLAQDSGATNVTASYVVGGYLAGGLDKVSGVVSFVLNEQLQRLKRFVETGAAGAK